MELSILYLLQRASKLTEDPGNLLLAKDKVSTTSLVILPFPIFDNSETWANGEIILGNINPYLSNFLINNGHDVIYDLGDKDIDLILLTDPRSRKESSSTFNHQDIESYKKYINQNVSVVQRINECDERKNTTGTNQIYLEASNTADHVIFVSSWLRDLYLKMKTLQYLIEIKK